MAVSLSRPGRDDDHVTCTITGMSPSGMYSAYLASKPCSLTGFRPAEKGPTSEPVPAPAEMKAPTAPPTIAAWAVSRSCASPGWPYESLVKIGAPAGTTADWYGPGITLPSA